MNKLTHQNKISGVVQSVQVVESQRLIDVRRDGYQQFCAAGSFNNQFGRDFSGHACDFNKLSSSTRDKINQLVVKDLILNPLAWERKQKIYVAEDRPAKNNLVLTQGIEQIVAQTTIPTQATRYCAVGTGTTPASSTDVGLVAEVKRTGNYLTGSGNCGTTYGVNYQVMRRTYDFTEEVASRNYTELGFSYLSSSGNNLFSRLLISGGSVTVGIGQALRVVYDLTLTFDDTQYSGNINMGAVWGSIPATWGAVNPFTIGNVDTNGNGNTGDGLFVFNNLSAVAVSGDFSWSFSNQATGYTALSSELPRTLSAYVAGTFNRTLSYNYWSAASFNSTVIRGFWYGRTDQYGFNNYIVKFNSNQTKLNTQRLRPCGITVSYST